MAQQGTQKTPCFLNWCFSHGENYTSLFDRDIDLRLLVGVIDIPQDDRGRFRVGYIEPHGLCDSPQAGLV